MCGIVGYVGDQPALGGRDRGSAAAGVPRLRLRRRRAAGRRASWSRAKRAGKLANLEAAARGAPAAARHHRHRATPAGPPTARPTTATPTRTSTAPAAVAVIHNGIIENFAPLRAELEARGHELCQRHRHRGRRAPARGRAPRAARSTSPRRCARVCRRLEGAFTLVATHADAPDVVVGARRNSPLVVGRGEGENFLASDVAAFIAHTREAIELGQDQVVELRRDGVTVTDFDGNPAEVREYHVDWDAVGRREGRLRLLHAQGDRRAAAGGRRHPARPDRRRRAAAARRDAALRRRAARRSTRSSSSPAARRSTPA